MSKEFTQQEWDFLINAHPPGTELSGVVTHQAVYGVHVKLDELPDVKALLELIHFEAIEASANRKLQFPQDYPMVGERITAQVLGWCLKPVDVRLTQLSHLNWCHSEHVREQNNP